MRDREVRGGEPVQYDVFSDVAVKHFMKPRNQQPLPQVNGKGCTSSDALDDFMQVSVLIDRQGIIQAIRCRTVGSAAAVACGSIFTELVEGLHVQQALEVSAQDVERALQGLPKGQRYCAELPRMALRAALENHEERRRTCEARRQRRSFVYRRLTAVRA